jgi:site-specific DNA recombinase
MTNPASGAPYVAPLRFAWWGRVSTEDQQDPTLSLPRQLHTSRAALPSGAVIVAHFYDVESGRRDLELRGRGTAHERFDIPIPRDGGIQELIEEAQRTDRSFDAVICESIERIARRTYYGTKIEHDLEQAGVALFAADEPILLNGKRATTILTRRVKQGVAEWYVLELLEKSWDGFREHARQGWNVGRPPYGYVAEKIPHPVPARRAEGRTKSKLTPEPVRAAAVHQMFAWRTVQRLGYGEIAERLNSDLDLYPPPVSPDPARCRDSWAASSVRDILHNPKYTGYMVWNRRATKKGGKVNPPEAWVWSEEPTHEAIVTRDIFETAMGMTEVRKRSRNGSGPNVKHPDTKHSYPLRSFIICALCGCRMFGKTNRAGTPYYVCQPSLNWGSDAKRQFPDHPPTVWVREDHLLEGIIDFFGGRVFGPQRRDLLEDDLRAFDWEPERKRQRQMRSLRRAIEKLDDAQTRLVRKLEVDDDPEGILFRRVRERLSELEHERLLKIKELEPLEAEQLESVPGAVELLDELPIGEDLLASAPDDVLRQLFQTFRLEVRFDKPSHRANCRVTIDEDSVAVLGSDSDKHSVSPGWCTDVGSAPGRIRTCAPRSGGACSIP